MDISWIIQIIQWLENYFSMPGNLLSNIIATETGGGNINAINPNAVNYGSGAKGLAQLTPITVQEIYRVFGIQINPFNPVQAVLGAALYLWYLYRQFGDWTYTVMAYNWGPGNVRKYIAYRQAGYNVGIPAETSNYIRSVFGG